MAQALLDAGRHQAWIAAQATHLILVREQCEQPAGNQMSGRLLPRTEEQEDHGDQFVLAEPPAVRLDIAQSGD